MPMLALCLYRNISTLGTTIFKHALMADRNKVDETPNYGEPASDLSVTDFLEAMLRHVR